MNRRPVLSAEVATASPTGSTLMLVLATTGFALTFWAWALLGPLGPSLREQLDLSINQQSVVVAVPIIMGSLGRVPIGALTDRYGARMMLPLVSLIATLPVLYLGHFARSYVELLIGGFFLGLAGTTFAIGVPFVNSWYPPGRRGTALGIFGAGMGGTAIAAFTTVPLSEALGWTFPFTLVALLLTVYALVAWLTLRDHPARVVPRGGVLARTLRTLRMPTTLPLAMLYAVAFGGFVAFSVYLPTYLRNAYGLTPVQSSLATAGFVLVAVAARPTGGYLSDRFGAVRVLAWAFCTVTVLASIASMELPLRPAGTLALLGIAAALGAGAGAVLALVAHLVPAEHVGTVTGIVGAAGGLGGFFPPLVMGAAYSAHGTYAGAYMLFASTAALALVYTVTVVRAQTLRTPSRQGRARVR